MIPENGVWANASVIKTVPMTSACSVDYIGLFRNPKDKYPGLMGRLEANRHMRVGDTLMFEIRTLTIMDETLYVQP